MQKQSISIKGVDIPRPIQFFEENQFPKYLKDELERSGFKAPTAIQSQGWLIALSGRDMVGIADTGSGKTLAYLLPGIVHAMAQELVSPGDSPIILVLVPTRELCIQVEKECRKFASIWRMSTIAVYRGASRSEQLAHYERGVDIMNATSGRLIDFVSAKDMNLKRVTYLVLDEADRMLDMGFEQKIKLIWSQIRPDRQTLMFSATWPKEVQSLAQQYWIEKPAETKIGSNDLTVNKRITQIVQVVEESDKYSSLVKILIKIVPGSKIIIFWGTKLRCNELEQQLIRDHCSPAVLHGDKSQSEREFIIKQFKSKAKNILIATDIASRGLHIDNVMYIINYDFPNQIEDYVHRIGSTGRAGSTGTAYSLFTKKNFMLVTDLASIIKRADQVVPEELEKYVALAQSTKSEHVFRRWNTVHGNSESKKR